MTNLRKLKKRFAGERLKVKNNILVKAEEVELPSWSEKIEDFLLSVMELTNAENQDVSICFCSDDFIKNLNSQYRQIDEPTDVLSFELGTEYEGENGESRFCAGDIVISLAALERNTKNFSVAIGDELKRLLVHGFLHLEGYDHGQFHIGKDGAILDEQEKVPVYKDLDENFKAECDMLILQEEILYKLSDKKIIE